ncbi:hypothetical protein [Fibrella aquatilis]|uniref:Transposase (putative) YhgA-like domain-containing protein n=1 Tax=Fibrella aquatilis TaxID=2817059 RepID=A0A939G988_9BACT|nr:hypothetical protein [Fibrella aquatilis]MBO0934171.1 hypothetical protein [Fibrella aquatilis]
MGKQVSQYDKIFKENIEAVIPSLMQNILHITAVESEELPDDVQHTKERKPDVLKKITDTKGDTYVLQIEFQVADEPEMVYRMAEYYVMLTRKYNLPVKQFVIFLGPAKPQMAASLTSSSMQFDYSLITFSDLDYQIFLRSSRPEEVVLGILGDFKGDSTEKALSQIIQRIDETAKGDFPLKKYFKQLRVLSQLRKLEKYLKDLTMDSISKFVSIERDPAYLVAQEKEQIKFVVYLLKDGSHTIDQIADIAGVSAEFVKNVEQNLIDNK